jgi:hypothetical protein
MKIVKTMLRNRIRDRFMNDCIICFVESGFLATIPIDDVIVRFHKMEDRNRTTVEKNIKGIQLFCKILFCHNMLHIIL